MIRRRNGRHERGEIGNRGFGLVEVMVALSILGLALAYSSQVQGGAMALIESNQDTMTATADLQAAMEQVLLLPHDNIPTTYIAGTTYTGASAAAAGPFTSILWPIHLRNERITVTYPDGSTADPLEILVTVNFSDKKGRARTMTLTTMKTR